ncbi:hypothetical protein NMY22_g17186 [Coprinellus aureogranulatus]|nr:hypothetical protein NMY22_g17186 [Coprinellus aureogranulatus]
MSTWIGRQKIGFRYPRSRWTAGPELIYFFPFPRLRTLRLICKSLNLEDSSWALSRPDLFLLKLQSLHRLETLSLTTPTISKSSLLQILQAVNMITTLDIYFTSNANDYITLYTEITTFALLPRLHTISMDWTGHERQDSPWLLTGTLFALHQLVEYRLSKTAARADLTPIRNIIVYASRELNIPYEASLLQLGGVEVHLRYPHNRCEQRDVLDPAFIEYRAPASGFPGLENPSPIDAGPCCTLVAKSAALTAMWSLVSPLISHWWGGPHKSDIKCVFEKISSRSAVYVFPPINAAAFPTRMDDPSVSLEPASLTPDCFDAVVSALEPLGLRHLPGVRRDVIYEIGDATEDLTRRIADTEEEVGGLRATMGMQHGAMDRRIDGLSAHVTFLEEKLKTTEDSGVRGKTAQIQSTCSLARSAMTAAEQAHSEIRSLKSELEHTRRKISSLQLGRHYPAFPSSSTLILSDMAKMANLIATSDVNSETTPTYSDQVQEPILPISSGAQAVAVENGPPNASTTDETVGSRKRQSLGWDMSKKLRPIGSPSSQKGKKRSLHREASKKLRPTGRRPKLRGQNKGQRVNFEMNVTSETHGALPSLITTAWLYDQLKFWVEILNKLFLALCGVHAEARFTEILIAVAAPYCKLFEAFGQEGVPLHCGSLSIKLVHQTVFETLTKVPQLLRYKAVSSGKVFSITRLAIAVGFLGGWFIVCSYLDYLVVVEDWDS